MKMFAAVVALGCATLATAISAKDLTEEQVKDLEAKCEAAREAKLKPLREAEIARCKTEGRNDADYCERYYRDLGNAARLPNGSFKPRMFDNLPECVAAFEARQALIK